MKKISITLLILLGVCSMVSAQRKPGDKFGVGFGYNGAYLTDNSSYNSADYISGFNAQVYAEHYFNYEWSLKVKAIYDQKGWSGGYIGIPGGKSIYDVNFNLNYITVPVLANWHFGRKGSWYADFGPYIGFLTSAKAAGYDFKYTFNTTDGGLAYGIGVKLPVARKTNFFVEYDGQSGVTNISKYGATARNERISLNIGLEF